MLTVRDYKDGELFWNEVARPLSARPVYNNVFVGVANGIRANASRDLLRFGVFDGGNVVLGALRTPPHQLNIADLGQGEGATAALAAYMAENRIAVPGVVGHEHLATRFADRWSILAGAKAAPSARHGWRQNLYQVLKVRPPENVAGRMRLPRAAERDMLVEWYLRFAKDADLPKFEHDPAHAARMVDDGFGDFVLWDVDGAAVAMARRRPIETMGVRIGAVYTPDDKRGRGYAAALTAALAERILSQGLFCCLHADAANALTNRLYQRIGFIKLATFADIMFSG